MGRNTAAYIGGTELNLTQYCHNTVSKTNTMATIVNSLDLDGFSGIHHKCCLTHHSLFGM